jgi:hypothetical protein
MTQLHVDILKEIGISSAFVRANSYIIGQHAELFTDQDDIKNKQLLEMLWLEEFRATLVYDSIARSYSKIVFENVNDMTIFLVKWG